MYQLGADEVSWKDLGSKVLKLKTFGVIAETNIERMTIVNDLDRFKKQGIEYQTNLFHNLSKREGNTNQNT